ncbi:MAG: hypothetical protein LBE61_09525 [Burkholderiaceae bacterium]|jgi:hypothetical protein|nr:hypothetical protein [Burkholderiaceae bacterium]
MLFKQSELLAEFNVAQIRETEAILALSNALKSGVKDEALLLQLTEHMTTSHQLKMDAWERLQPTQG